MKKSWKSCAASWLAAMALYAGAGLAPPARADEFVIGQLGSHTVEVAVIGANGRLMKQARHPLFVPQG
jgi:hypothetical protein